MKARKNLEAIFIVAAVVTNFASFAVAKVPAVQAVKPVQASVAVIKGQRLSAAGKAALN
jgi:hypothetical protein